MKPAFIITIDTEPDNQWIPGASITCNNLRFIPRFQNLAETYGFKPVWLTEYNVACDKWFVEYISSKLIIGTCEIGIHPHAWTSPPIFPLTENDQIYKPYMTDYPVEVIEQKISIHSSLLKSQFGTVLSHRSGRWAMNQAYAQILIKNGIRYDCTINPGIVIPPSSSIFSENSCDYTKFKHEVIDLGEYYCLDKSKLYEIPYTVLVNHKLQNNKTIPHFVKKRLFPIRYLRPDGTNLKSLLYIVKKAKREKWPYLQFMLHSSELMPGCNPTFKTPDSIEKLYKDLEILFRVASKSFSGQTLTEFMKYRTSA